MSFAFLPLIFRCPPNSGIARTTFFTVSVLRAAPLTYQKVCEFFWRPQWRRDRVCSSCYRSIFETSPSLLPPTRLLCHEIGLLKCRCCCCCCVCHCCVCGRFRSSEAEDVMGIVWAGGFWDASRCVIASPLDARTRFWLFKNAGMLSVCCCHPVNSKRGEDEEKTSRLLRIELK